MKKRILTLAMLLIFAMSIFSVSANTATPYEPSIYGRQVQFLIDMGFIGGNDASNDSVNMTRAEFVTLVLKVLGVGDIVSSGSYEQVFDDVSPSHYAYNYIMYAYECGLFNGETQNIFNPDGDITMNQAITVAVKMLGYGHHAEAMGAWPSGYIAMANTLKLTDGINIISGREAAHKSWVHILIYNTLHTDMVIHTGIGDGLNYEVYEDRNILTENHNVEILEGIVTSVGDVCLYGKEAGEGRISVDETIVETNGLNTDGLLGKRVTLYAQKDGKKLFAKCVYEDGNITLTVTSDNIENFEYESGIYHISDNNKTKKIRIGNDYHLIWNSTKITGSQSELMSPVSGSITFTDNDDDGVYEIVCVEEYYNLVVSYYDPYKNILYDANPDDEFAGIADERNVDFNDYDTVISDIDVGEFKPGSVVSVFKSYDGSSVKLAQSPVSVSGIINEMRKDEKTVLSVNGMDYEISADCRSDVSNLRAGMEISALCDVYGKIAYVSASSSYLSGYVLEFSDPSSKGFDSDEVNILTSNGTTQAYKLASKVKIRTPYDVEKVESADVAVVFGTPSRGFVLFETNDKREITEIILPLVINTKEELDNPVQYPLYKMDYFITQWPEGSDSKLYREEINGFDNWLVFDSQANVFTVPGENDAYSSSNVDAGKISSFTNKSYKQLPADINAPRVIGEFDVYRIGSSSFFPNVMINYSSVSAKPISQDSAPCVVSSITTVYDEKQSESVVKLGIIQGASISEYKVREDLPLIFAGENLGVGDVIKFSLDADGYIENIELYYSRKLGKLISNPAENYSSIDLLCRLAYGEVITNTGGYLEILMEYAGNTKIERYSIKGMRTVVVAKRNNKVFTELATSDVITPGDKIIIYSRYLKNSLIIAYKEA